MSEKTFRVGALVKLKEEAVNSVAYGEELRDVIGIITDWTDAPANSPFGSADFTDGYGDGWVLWNGRDNLAIVFEEDLILLNE